MKATGYGFVCGCALLAYVYAAKHEMESCQIMMGFYLLASWFALVYTKGDK